MNGWKNHLRHLFGNPHYLEVGSLSGEITKSEAKELKALIRDTKKREVILPIVGERTIAYPGADRISPAERKRINSRPIDYRLPF
jgi:hypothetical protein